MNSIIFCKSHNLWLIIMIKYWTFGILAVRIINIQNHFLYFWIMRFYKIESNWKDWWPFLNFDLHTLSSFEINKVNFLLDNVCHTKSTMSHYLWLINYRRVLNFLVRVRTGPLFRKNTLIRVRSDPVEAPRLIWIPRIQNSRRCFIT